MMDEGKHMYLSKELKNVRTRGQRLLAKSNLGSMIPRMVAMFIKELLIQKKSEQEDRGYWLKVILVP